MRGIRKSPEPMSLTRYREQPGAVFEDYSEKAELRTALVREQRGLCCYCLSRIRDSADSTKVEHWHSQSHYPAEALQYSNLLAVCKGGEGAESRGRHCDTSKGDRDLLRNPANPLHPC